MSLTRSWLRWGYEGSARTMRRWVAEAKRRWCREHGRRTRLWIPEPGVVDPVGLHARALADPKIGQQDVRTAMLVATPTRSALAFEAARLRAASGSCAHTTGRGPRPNAT